MSSQFMNIDKNSDRKMMKIKVVTVELCFCSFIFLDRLKGVAHSLTSYESWTIVVHKIKSNFSQKKLTKQNLQEILTVSMLLLSYFVFQSDLQVIWIDLQFMKVQKYQKCSRFSFKSKFSTKIAIQSCRKGSAYILLA